MVAPWYHKLVDPLELKELLWPSVRFYKEERDIIYSVIENDETVVPAANQMGKDFVSGFLVLYTFLTRTPCRIVTTSAKDDHLRVLWGEINRFIDSSKYPLDHRKGGPLIINHQSLRKMIGEEECPISYVIGMVAAPDRIAAMQGHHANPLDASAANDRIPRTLFVSDESSSVPDDYFKMAGTWAKRMLIIGNTWPCENYFKHAIKGRPGTEDRGGDIPRPNGQGYVRKVIKIKAEQSPNVRYGMAEVRAGKEPTDTIIVPGVKTHSDYVKHRSLWDKIKQCVSLDADFYEGAEVLMFPPAWLDAAERRAAELTARREPRKAKAMGIDPAEGGDSSVWTIIDEYGVIAQISKKTPNTAFIPNYTIALGNEYNIPSEKWIFDRGGGGYEHASTLRERGYNPVTVGFGEGITPELQRGLKVLEVKKEEREERYAYKNRRAEMYGTLRLVLDPETPKYLAQPFALPRELGKLRQQLAPIPLMYDAEGRMELLPKNVREMDNINGTKQRRKTLVDLVGHSPDEADSLVLALWGLLYAPEPKYAGAI